MRITLSSLQTDFAHCIREKLATRLLTRKYEVVDKFDKWTIIEHSENEIAAQSGLFKNKIAPGVLHCGVQQVCALQEC